MPDSLFSPEVQSVLNNAKAGGAFPSPIDWRDQWIYFLLVDRFNNPAAAPRFQWNGTDDKYQGGSYAGVLAQLPYIKKLGAGAIWLSPVLNNFHFPFAETYHGYGIHNFIRAETKFASDPAHADDELRALVDAAHKLGLYVIFDIVLNHTGDAFDYDGFGHTAPHQDSGTLPVHWRDASGNPEFSSIEGIASPPEDALVWPSEFQKDAYYRRQGVTDGDGVIGDFSSLKQFRTDNVDLENALIRAYQCVIARFDCDGFRIDTL
ncbi:MAG: hypothetical protein JO022_10180, partial [Acidobacteriaceae bacterium]|nr:hypothetical protein [Acidobacteriaceae bacterium]